MIVEQVRGRRWGREEEGGGKREEGYHDYMGSFLD